VLQCFNCYGYGHIARRCGRQTIYGECAGPYSTRDHIAKKGETKKCNGCGRVGHQAWDKACKVREKEDYKLQQRLQNKRQRYGSYQRGPHPIRIAPNSITTGEGNWSLVQARKRKATGD